MSETESTMPAPDEYSKTPAWKSPEQGQTKIEENTLVTNLSYRVLQTGETIGNRYKIIGKLGSGGFAMTYLAKDLLDPRKSLCVVKHLQPRFNNPTACESARSRFQREANVLGRLGSHPQIPRLIDYFEEGREFYLVQEFVPGEELKKIVNHGVWTEIEVIAFLIDVLQILEFVHSQAAIHRDIKPSNLIRRQEDGKMVLIDFGAVKEAGTLSDGAGMHTLQTQIIGTPGYMSPEQTHGKPIYSSDIYGLGRTAIFALTGRSPLDLEETGTEDINCWQELTQVSPKLGKIIDKMIRPKPSERYHSVKTVLHDLQPLRELGSIVGDRYRILRYLGGSEARHAYLAQILSEESETDLFFEDPVRDSQPDLCVVKTIEPLVTESQSRQQVELFLREKLNKWTKIPISSHIPQIADYFWQEGRFYLVEEYFKGKNLKEELTTSQAWSQEEAIFFLSNILPAIDSLHKQGFIHRQLRPSNFIRLENGEIAVIDGIIPENIVEGYARNGAIDRDYLPPDIKEDAPHPSDDLYSLGKIVLQFLTKLPEIESNDRQKINSILQVKLERGAINRKFYQIALKMTETERSKRYQTVDRLLKDLKIAKRKSSKKIGAWLYLIVGLLLTTGAGILGYGYWLQYQALLLFDQGDARLELGQYDTALDYYQQGIDKLNGKVFERVERAWIGKATALSHLKRYGEMRQTCEEILNVNRNSVYAWNCVGLALLGMENYRGAISAFNEAFDRDPSFFDSANNRGYAYMKLGEEDKAQSDFQTAIRLDPKQSYVPLNNLAQLYYQQERYSEAFGHYQKAIELKKDYLPAWIGLGNSQRQLGYKEQALVTFDRALTLDSRSSEAWYFKGLAEEDLGRLTDAKLSLEKSLSLAPDNRAAREALDRLEGN